MHQREELGIFGEVNVIMKMAAMRGTTRRLGAAALLCGSALVSMPALAQDVSVAGPEAEDQAVDQGGEIVVTALKRAQGVQDAPATIGVVSADTIANTGVVNLQQLAAVAPGLILAKAPTGNEVGVTIRGLGSSPGVPSFESSVSLFVDGVYAPRSREFAASMFDVERIEVIRGTQGALLGKNTSLGAINLVGRTPGDEFAFDGRVSYEFDRGSTVVSAGVDLPMANNLKLRVAGQYSNDRGFMRNNVLGTFAPRIRDRSVRGTLVWEPTDTIDVTAVAQHALQNNYGSPVEIFASTGLPEVLAALAGSPGVIRVGLNRVGSNTSPRLPSRDQVERMVIDRYSLTANFGLGDHVLTSLTGYSRYRVTNEADGDGVPGDYVTRDVDEVGTQFSQEIRLVSPSNEPFEYILGGLYLAGELDNSTIFRANMPFGPAPGVNITGTQRTDFVQDNEAVSLFAQSNYTFDNGLRFSGSVRWTSETKDVDLSRVAVVPGFFSTVIFPQYAPFSLRRTETNFDYSFGAQYEIDSDVMIYASYGQGTKGGGFAQSVTLLQNAEYESEVAKTLEVGAKLQDPSRRWLLNIAGFNTYVDRFQLVTFTGIQFIVANTDLRSRGFEIEASWNPIPDLRLFLNNTYAHAKDRRTGNDIPLAPRWSGSGGFAFETGIATSVDFKLDGSVDYRSQQYYQQDTVNTPPGEAIAMLNLGAAVADSGDAWELRLIGRNLTNANSLSFLYPLALLPPGNFAGISTRGRTVALQLSVRF